MAYWRDKWESDNSIEYELKYAGRYGAKGEQRAKKKKATPDQIKKQNQRNKENRVRRLLQANFYPNDLWITLKYPKGTRKSMAEAADEMKRFLRGMRKDYRIRGEAFKYIYRIEIGKMGGVHIHILLNRIWGADLLASKNWAFGNADYSNVREEGGMAKLAAYIVKPMPEDSGQMSFLPEEKKQCVRYSTSRNLIRPEPERKHYSKRTVRTLIENGPKASPGFYIDKDSIISGINPYTGYSYFRYRELALHPVRRRIRMPDKEKEKGAKMKEVNIYIYNGITGVKRQEGIIGYVMETRSVKGKIRTLEQFYRIKNVTRAQAELTILTAALKRLLYPCNLMVYTAFDGIAAAYDQGWVKRWQETGWVTSKGKDVANKEEWQQFLNALNLSSITFKTQDKHTYSGWMSREIEINPDRVKEYPPSTEN